jgi:uncharacterized protein YlxW (UPF0749 family)
MIQEPKSAGGAAGSGAADPAGSSNAVRSTWTTALLDDLLTNTLDPGYRAAADAKQRSHPWDQPLVWLGCLAVGLLLVTAYQQNHRSAPAREAANKDLITRIHNLQSAGARMDEQAKTLAAQVAALRDAQLSGAGSAELKNLEIAAGTVAVSGPGVSIEVGEPTQPQPSASSGRDGTGSQQQVSLIHDRQIRSVVNVLWSSGAEAISVNGIRLTATSAIRFAGESILVDFQTISTPYTIQAIGDRDRMLLAFADSPIARALKTAEQVQGISFNFAGRPDLRLGSVTVVQQSYASPGASASIAPGGAAGPSPTTTGGQPSPRGSARTGSGSNATSGGASPSAGKPAASSSPTPSITESHQ